MTPEIANHIRGMEVAGKMAAETLKFAQPYIKAGISTNEIDKIVHDYILSRGAIPAPLNYHGFPKSVCTSVNEIICHGVPDKTVLKDGDIMNLDVTVIYNGFYGDTSRTYFIGNVSDKAKDITDCAEKAMLKGIAEVKTGATTGDIGFAINKYVTRRGYYVVHEIGGHGIGTAFHQDPFVPSHGKKGKGDILKKWTCITVEPMINETDVPILEHDISDSSIKWYTTGDSSLTAQFEHTVLITDEGARILTIC